MGRGGPLFIIEATKIRGCPPPPQLKFEKWLGALPWKNSTYALEKTTYIFYHYTVVKSLASHLLETSFAPLTHQNCHLTLINFFYSRINRRSLESLQISTLITTPWSRCGCVNAIANITFVRWHVTVSRVLYVEGSTFCGKCDNRLQFVFANLPPEDVRLVDLDGKFRTNHIDYNLALYFACLQKLCKMPKHTPT